MTFLMAGGFEEAVAKLPEIDATAHEAAEKIAETARDLAPVVSGDYKAGIVVQKTKSGYRVFASDPKSAWIEFGVPTDNEPAKFVLRRATEAAGYTFAKRTR